MPRLVLVHGFTQTAMSWRPVVERVAGLRGPNAEAGLRGPNAEAGLRGPNAEAGVYEIMVPELPGHGGNADVRLGFEAAAAAIGTAGGRAIYVGYSMGGRLCLRLALDRPDLVQALVLVGATAGLADARERVERRAEDERVAAEIERVGTDAFLERWLAQPLFSSLHPSPDDVAARRRNPPAGLAAALRTLGTGVQEPLWDRLAELGMPVLLVAGEGDSKFAALAERMAAAIGPNATVALVEGAGHAAHLERPDAFCRLLPHPATE